MWALSEGEATPAAELVGGIVDAVVGGIQFSKTMRWDDGRFSRPVRWLVAMLDGDVAPAEAFGLRSDNLSHGHRVLGGEVRLTGAGHYVEQVRSVKVVADAAERRELIEAGLDAAGEWIDPMGKLDEVVHLVEWPSVHVGRFDDRYLELPLRVPVTAMQSHQRYFPMVSGGRSSRALSSWPTAATPRSSSAATRMCWSAGWRTRRSPTERTSSADCRRCSASLTGSASWRAAGRSPTSRCGCGRWPPSSASGWTPSPRCARRCCGPPSCARRIWCPPWCRSFPTCRDMRALSTRGWPASRRRCAMRSRSTTCRSRRRGRCRCRWRGRCWRSPTRPTRWRWRSRWAPSRREAGIPTACGARRRASWRSPSSAASSSASRSWRARRSSCWSARAVSCGESRWRRCRTRSSSCSTG